MEDSHRRRNNRLVRARNVKRILLLIRDQEPITIDSIASESSLTYPTVLGILKQLENSSHIEKIAYAPPSGGRQPVLYGVSRVARYVLGMHIGRDSVSICITNVRGAKIFQTAERTAGHQCSEKGLDPEEISRTVLLVKAVLEKTGLEIQNFVRIGLSYRQTMLEKADKTGKALEEFFSIPVNTVPDSHVLNFMERQSFHISSIRNYIFIWYDGELNLSIYRNTDESVIQPVPLTYFSHLTMVPGKALFLRQIRLSQCICNRRRP